MKIEREKHEMLKEKYAFLEKWWIIKMDWTKFYPKSTKNQNEVEKWKKKYNQNFGGGNDDTVFFEQTWAPTR